MQQISELKIDDWRDLIFLQEGEKVDENLNCQICTLLAVDPVECADCQNVFCSWCINEWRKQKKAVTQILITKCIFRCKSNPIQTKPIHRLLRNAYNELKFKCPNRPKGCQVLTQIEKIDAHLRQCQFRTQEQDLKLQIKELSSIVKQHENEIKLLKEENTSIKNDQKILTKQLLEIKQYLRISPQDQGMKKNFGADRPYVCDRGHQLIWGDLIFHSQCGGCDDSDAYLRYRCQTCRKAYCSTCFVPKIVDLTCPNKHKLQLLNNNSPTRICDICLCKPLSEGLSVYNDMQCNFDICGRCLNIQ